MVRASCAAPRLLTMERVGAILLSAVSGLGLEERMVLESLRRQWHLLFGEPLSRHIFPADLKDSELLVNVDSPVWLQQLKFFKSEMTAKLKPYHVKEVRLRLGRVQWSHRQKGLSRDQGEIRRLKALTESDAIWIEGALKPVEDSDLKESIKRTIERSISQPINP